MIKFSIVIPLYNKALDIQDTLKSVSKQSHNNFEVILVNDGSTDSSLEKIKGITDKRIHLYNNPHKGVSAARNFGVSKASTNYIAFLDADDYWHPNHLENLQQLIIEFPTQQWFATAYERKHHAFRIRPMQSPIMNQQKPWKGVIQNYFKNSLISPLAWTSAVCMKKDFFDALNGFDLKTSQDTDLWIRAALKSPLVFSNTITARHNLNAKQRISHLHISQKTYMNLDKYNVYASDNNSLKHYLDLNRYSFAIQHKLANDIFAFRKYAFGIDPNHLNKKQRFLLKQSPLILRLLKGIKNVLENFGLRLSVFK